jgi:mono/diheme cytochrome c family protein
MRSYLRPAGAKGKRAGQMLIPGGEGRLIEEKAPANVVGDQGGRGVMPKFLAGTFGLVATLAVALSAAAQEQGNAEAGHELASNLCTACHIVGDQRSGSDLAPPFPAIAKDPDVSVAELHGWGGAGHPMLPNLVLTPEQVADINAYLDSLRGAPVERTTPPRKPALPQAPPEKIGPPIGTQPPPD